MNNIEKLISLAKEAYSNAYAPYSGFKVGSSIVDEKGCFYSGCNVENAAYPSGSCAEEIAIGAMIRGGGRVIKEILIIGKSNTLITPCGACRQRIREFADSDTLIHICDINKGYIRSFRIDELLAYSFGPANL